jgi:hypothetical protein
MERKRVGEKERKERQMERRETRERDITTK